MDQIEPCKKRLSSLEKRAQSFIYDYRQNIAILGNDREEIFYTLERYLQKNKLDQITYIRTKSSYISQKDFFKNILISILSEYTQTTETLDNLINITQEALVATTTFARETLRKDRPSFLDSLELINKFILETDRSCILLIEEFVKMKEVFPHFSQAFSKFIILQKKCMVVLTSSQIKEAQRILASELNLLFGNFEQIHLNDGNFLDNYLYLKELLKTRNPSPFFLSFFINIMGSNIVYYDLMAPVIKKYYRKNNEEQAIISILERTLYCQQTYFAQKFIKKMDLIEKSFKSSWIVYKILSAINDGYIRRSELLSLGIFPSREIKLKLQKMVDLNYIEDLGNIYKISDSLFSFWFSNVFSVYNFPSCFGSQKRTDLWRKKINQQIVDFKENFYKEGIKKILDLLSSFKDDTLRSGKNQYKLPSSDRLKMISYPERDLHLIIGEGKRVIFTGVKESEVDDADIFDFLEKGKGLGTTNIRKIFISFKRFSSTAKLIAKDHKIMALDVDEVNRLLDIYNKPMISFGASLDQ